MSCAKVEPMVHGLKETHGDKMTFTIKDYQKDDSSDLIAKYELGVHGMVIVDDKGAKVWSEEGHKQELATVESAVKSALGL